MTTPKARIEATKRNADDAELWDVTIAGDDGDCAYEVTYRAVSGKQLSKWQRLDAAAEMTLLPGKVE